MPVCQRAPLLVLKVSLQALSGALLACVQQFTDALASLERILLTPIPWSYAAHIYEVAWLYCIILVSRRLERVSCI